MPRSFWNWFKKNPLAPWAIAFILLNVLVSQDGESNAGSRYATLQAMTEHHSFQIDTLSNYKEYTGDWSRAPNGHIYSNKAPGPMFVAFPIAWVLSTLMHHKPFGMGAKSLVCLFTQVIPFAIVVLLLGDALEEAGVSLAARNLAAVAMLFGNTADLFLNNLFGHGMAALFVLVMALGFVKRRWEWAGFGFGFAVLSDYGAGFLGPPLLLAVLWVGRQSFWKSLGRFILGGVLPGALWVGYHWSCFGSPFALPMRYTNPEVLDPGPPFLLFRSAAIWLELLVGPHRGILFTQPWVYVVLASVFLIGRKEYRSIAFVVTIGFLGVLGMNAGFSGWHGGATAGPRYMALIFPAFGFLIGAVYDRMRIAGKSLLFATVAAAVFLRMLIYCDILYAMPDTNLWKYYFGSMLTHFFSKWAVSFFTFWLIFGVAAYRQIRKPLTGSSISI